MKKVFILSVFTFIGFAIQAQIKYGIKAGANFTTFSGSDAKMEGISPKYKVGFAGGGLVNIQLSEMFSLQPEVLYSLEGTTYKAQGESVHFKTDYVNIPVLAQYNNPSGFYAETGPQVGFLTSAKLSADGNSVDIKDGFKKINFSWGFGAGYKLSNGLGIGARYNLGLTSIADEDGGESPKIKVGGFHLGLSYTFGGANE
ncbi:porin family protein [Agriterribacter sp.]|uniref:porin family protein n=1 Tax=Agriterribacter sp. TaxID=2821509 RepID=UPI002B81D7ED|nr:porin family protein [Agriterribacter sp.]HRO47270.1 porin family protein [Agriterribacter sp.]HRQ16566.1 porin family protein [Agriterribacter sp.]